MFSCARAQCLLVGDAQGLVAVLQLRNHCPPDRPHSKLMQVRSGSIGVGGATRIQSTAVYRKIDELRLKRPAAWPVVSCIVLWRHSSSRSASSSCRGVAVDRRRVYWT